MGWSRRELTYLVLRGAAAVAFILSALVVPRGGLAAAMCIGSGLVAVLTCIGTNAGGPGEQAGAWVEANRRESIRPPSGDWPPFDPAHDIEGELVRPPRSSR